MTEKPKLKETGWQVAAIGAGIAVAHAALTIVDSTTGSDFGTAFHSLAGVWGPMLFGGATYRQIEKRRVEYQPVADDVAQAIEPLVRPRPLTVDAMVHVPQASEPEYAGKQDNRAGAMEPTDDIS